MHFCASVCKGYTQEYTSSVKHTNTGTEAYSLSVDSMVLLHERWTFFLYAPEQSQGEGWVKASTFKPQLRECSAT